MNVDAIWGIVVGVPAVSFGAAFAYFEGKAFKDGRLENTLSATLRRWLGISPRRAWWPVGVFGFPVVLIGFAIWFAFHIAFGWWGLGL